MALIAVNKAGGRFATLKYAKGALKIGDILAVHETGRAVAGFE